MGQVASSSKRKQPIQDINKQRSGGVVVCSNSTCSSSSRSRSNNNKLPPPSSSSTRKSKPLKQNKKNKEELLLVLQQPPVFTPLPVVTTTTTASKEEEQQQHQQQQVVQNKEFLPYPYIRSDSKPPDPNNILENVVADLLQRYARQDISFTVDHYTLGATAEFPGEVWNVTDFIDLCRREVTAFLDFHFEYQLLGETSPGVVVAIIQACGTHTGIPYATPRHPKPLPARNARCKNDPEYFTCVFQGRKIKHCSFFPVSKETRLHGPDGLYRQIKEHNRELITGRQRQQHKPSARILANTTWATTA